MSTGRNDVNNVDKKTTDEAATTGVKVEAGTEAKIEATAADVTPVAKPVVPIVDIDTSVTPKKTELELHAAKLDEELQGRINNLHFAFSKAFAEADVKDKTDDQVAALYFTDAMDSKIIGNHPSQLAYQPIYIEFKKIFNTIDGTQSEEDITNKFDKLNEEHADRILSYVIKQGDSILAKPELKKKLKINQVRDFDPNVFYSDEDQLSIRKKKLLNSITNVFKELALQHLYLKKLAHKTASIKQEENTYRETLVGTINTYADKVIQAEKELAQYTHSVYGAEKKTTFDKLRDDVNDRDAITAELKKKLKDKTDSITNASEITLSKFETRINGLRNYPEKIKKEIASYQDYYNDVKKRIEEDKSNEAVIKAMVNGLNNDYKKLVKSINAYNDNMSTWKKELLENLKTERNNLTDSNYIPITPSEIEDINAIKNIQSHLNVSLPTTLGLVREASIQLNKAKKTLKDENKFEKPYKDSIRESRFDAVKTYNNQAKKVMRYSETLQTQCAEQTEQMKLLGVQIAGNPLWIGEKGAVAAVKENLQPVSEFSDGKRNELVEAEITSALFNIDNILIQEQNAFNSTVNRIQKQGNAVIASLSEYYNDAITTVKEVEKEIYDTAKGDAKKKSNDTLDGMIESVQSFEAAKLPNEVIINPTELVKLYQEKQAEKALQEKLAKEAELKRLAAEQNKKTAEEAEEAKKRLEAEARQKILIEQKRAAYPAVQTGWQNTQKNIQTILDSKTPENSAYLQDFRIEFAKLQRKDRKELGVVLQGELHQQHDHYLAYGNQYKNLEMEIKIVVVKNRCKEADEAIRANLGFKREKLGENLCVNFDNQLKIAQKMYEKAPQKIIDENLDAVNTYNNIAHVYENLMDMIGKADASPTPQIQQAQPAPTPKKRGLWQWLCDLFSGRLFKKTPAQPTAKNPAVIVNAPQSTNTSVGTKGKEELVTWKAVNDAALHLDGKVTLYKSQNGKKVDGKTVGEEDGKKDGETRHPDSTNPKKRN